MKMAYASPFISQKSPVTFTGSGITPPFRSVATGVAALAAR